MNRQLKKNIRAAFDAPAPKRKDPFLLSVNFPRTSRLGFVAAQAGYIRKRVWAVVLLAAAPAWIRLFPSFLSENTWGYLRRLLAHYGIFPSFLSGDTWGSLWVASSLLPFIALVGITEMGRSASHRMAELETACRFSFSDVVLARLGIMGFVHLLWFAAMLAAFGMMEGASVSGVPALRLVGYLFAPFLLTCALSLFAFNRLRDSLYVCGGIAGFVSVGNALFSSLHDAAFFGKHGLFWSVAAGALLMWTATEIITLLKRTEEPLWNWSLTA